jgi:cytochrome c553
MKKACFVMALVMLVAMPLSILAQEDGAALYKSKCSACHGEKGEGKPAAKMPAVKGISMDADQLISYLTKGESGKKFPHNNPVSGLSADQAKAVADFVKTLK